MKRRIHIKKDQKYGYLTVIREEQKYVSPSGAKSRKVYCKCECGNKTSVLLSHLRSGRIKSCGCYIKAKRLVMGITHGKTRTKEHNSWVGLRGRTLNPNDRAWKHYGGRGIKVCSRWEKSFENFLEDMGPAPDKKAQIDRINNDGHYEPSNCRWASPLTNNRNRRNVKKFQGLTTNEWAAVFKVPKSTMHFKVQKAKGLKQVVAKYQLDMWKKEFKDIWKDVM